MIANKLKNIVDKKIRSKKMLVTKELSGPNICSNLSRMRLARTCFTSTNVQKALYNKC